MSNHLQQCAIFGFVRNEHETREKSSRDRELVIFQSMDVTLFPLELIFDFLTSFCS